MRINRPVHEPHSYGRHFFAPVLTYQPRVRSVVVIRAVCSLECSAPIVEGLARQTTPLALRGLEPVK